jgi:mono/diheme cytochrome c family protein
VVTRFPDPAAQIAVVTDGRRGMPSFGGSLSADEIAAIVEYTRTILGT